MLFRSAHFGAITILPGAGLGGTGTVNNVTNSGTLFPGDYNSTTGAVFTANLVTSLGGIISFDLGTFGPEQHDRLVLSAMLGTTTLEIFDRTNSPLADGSTQTIVTKVLGVANVPFTGLPEKAAFTSSNHNFLITYKGGGSNDIALTLAKPHGAAATMGALTPLGNGVIQINGTGTSNSLYSLITTTNIPAPLANWTTVTTVLATNGGVQIKQTNAVNEPRRFYQLKSF